LFHPGSSQNPLKLWIHLVPKRVVSDFDVELIDGAASEYLNSLLILVTAAPSYRQDKNGLAERH
jgi:hypothetical protein